MTDARSYYRRNLPYYQPADGAIFVTFRLADSMPEHVRRQLVAERNRKLSQG